MFLRELKLNKNMKIKNVAIIAHVDHGKTTLVDALLTQSETKINDEVKKAGLIMDNNELERERGITIFSKNASLTHNGYKINIIDTPGHADFGGEVERVLSMADGALLLVDAKEGPMPQTRFVLKHALAIGLKVIVVVNKIDKKDARVDWVVGKTFDLFVELGADESSAFFPIVYASGKDGLAGKDPDLSKMTNIKPVFDAIVQNIPDPKGDPQKPLQMRVSTLGKDSFMGKIATGKIFNGKVLNGENIAHINREGESKICKITSLSTYVGLAKTKIDSAQAGDIVSITGISDVTIGETISDKESPKALPLLSIEEPTVKMKFMINDSPLGGKEGEFKTSNQIRARLFRELETDVALRVSENPDGTWTVSGRGELHLAILIERMRREGFEFQVTRPSVITKKIDGKLHTPFEKAYIEVPEEFSGGIIQKMGVRHAELIEMKTTDENIVYMEYLIATKQLIGFRSEFIEYTKGTGILNTVFEEFCPDDGQTFKRERGSLVAHETGETRLYGLVNVQDRGDLFFGPGLYVYKGQVIGQNSREEDIRVNVCKEKKLSNMRSKGDGPTEHFNTPRIMSLEDSLEYIDETELVEITPKSVRIRKIILDELEEKRKVRLMAGK